MKLEVQKLKIFTVAWKHLRRWEQGRYLCFDVIQTKLIFSSYIRDRSWCLKMHKPKTFLCVWRPLTRINSKWVVSIKREITKEIFSKKRTFNCAKVGYAAASCMELRLKEIPIIVMKAIVFIFTSYFWYWLCFVLNILQSSCTKNSFIKTWLKVKFLHCFMNGVILACHGKNGWITVLDDRKLKLTVVVVRAY